MPQQVFQSAIHKKDLLQGQYSFAMPQYNACFWSFFLLLLLIQLAVCSQDPEQCASDGLQGSIGLMPSMQYASCHTTQWFQQEESSFKLEYQSSDSQEWPCPSSLGVSEAESPDWEKELSYMFF